MKPIEPDSDLENEKKVQVELAENQIVEQSKRIEYYLTDYSVELLALKMGKGEFEIPGYQREDTWEDERKSRFVESLLMGLPIPFLFFWERGDGKLEVVDGSQRLRTIQQFIGNHMFLFHFGWWITSFVIAIANQVTQWLLKYAHCKSSN